MHRFQGKYRIPSARLKEWDYATAGYYYVTICTAGHQPFFGEITEGEMRLLVLGGVAEKFWIEIPIHFPNVNLDEFIVMPNHIHGIIVINEPVVETQQTTSGRQQLATVETQHAVGPDRLSGGVASLPKNKPSPGSLSAIVRSYKSAVTRWARLNGHSAFAWQARFYDHIIRSERSLDKIRAYIRRNPILWEEDEYHLGIRKPDWKG